MRYFVHSDYVNAWSIQKGLKILDKKIYNIGEGKRLLKKSKKSINKGDSIFFTEEKSLKKFFLLRDYNFYPKEIDFNLIDDKYQFAIFLEKIGEIPIPFYPKMDLVEKFPVFMKCKYSWKNDIKKERGYIINNIEEYEKIVEKFLKNKEPIEDYFFQKLLNSSPENNISVSGFFDYKNKKRNLVVVSKKTLGEGGKISTGCIIETIKDPNNLIKRTYNILSQMNFAGPFEMEFFYEKNDEKYYVLELNPRFWMQHGIFIDKYNNGIIKRYLNLDTEEDWVKNHDFKKIIWVNNIFYFKDRIKRNHQRLKIYNELINKYRGDIILYPDNKATVKYYIKLAMNRIYKREAK